MWDDENLDAAIDDAARRMTAGETGGDFRARVMARIDDAPPVQRLWQPLAAGLAAMAIVVIAVMIWQQHGGVRQRDTAEVRPPSPQSGFGGPGQPSAAEVRLPPSPQDGSGGPRQADATYRPRPDAAYASHPSDIEPLETPALDLESISVAALPADEAIHIDPLPPAAPIAVAPLDVENQGDRR
jgi:hypothetical protein